MIRDHNLRFKKVPIQFDDDNNIHFEIDNDNKIVNGDKSNKKIVVI